MPLNTAARELLIWYKKPAQTGPTTKPIAGQELIIPATAPCSSALTASEAPAEIAGMHKPNAASTLDWKGGGVPLKTLSVYYYITYHSFIFCDFQIINVCEFNLRYLCQALRA